MIRGNAFAEHQNMKRPGSDRVFLCAALWPDTAFLISSLRQFPNSILLIFAA